MSVEYDFVVDLSNVCRSDALGGAPNSASFERLKTLEKVLHRQLDRSLLFLYVADDSLWHLLRREHGNATVEEWRARNRLNLVEVPLADQSILAYSEGHECPVLSLDHFRDWRSEFPWIQGNNERFYGWRRHKGEVEAFRRSLTVLTDESISRHREGRELKGKGLDPSRPEDREIVEFMYCCGNAECELHQANPYFLISPPRRDRRTGSLVCTSCGDPVEPKGPVGPIRQLKVEMAATGAEGRFTIYQKQPTAVGRATLRKAIGGGSGADASGLARVSAKHLELVADREVLFVTELGSTNGTTIRRFDKRSNGLGAPETLAKGVRIALGSDDLLSLAGEATLRRSGVRHQFKNLTQGVLEVDEDSGTQASPGAT